MDTGSEPLKTGEPDSVVQQQREGSTPRHQRIIRALPDIRPTPGSNVTRIYGISDCVIAVAFTLFVVNIHLPPAGLSESQLQSFIKQDILPDILFYLGTYLVVASSWISHYRIITHLKRSSSLFIILNIVFLASIVFLPVPVVFFYIYGNQAETWRVFALTQVVTSTTLLLMWAVARIDHLLDPETPPGYLSYTTARLVVIPLGTLLSLGISYYNVWVAEGIFLFFYVLGWVLRSLLYRQHPGERYLQGTVRMCSITDNMTAVAITFLIATITGTLISNTQQSFSTATGRVMAERRIAFLRLFLQELQQELAEGGCCYDMPSEVVYSLLWGEKREEEQQDMLVEAIKRGRVVALHQSYDEQHTA